MANYTFYNGNNGSGGSVGTVNATPGKNYDLQASGAPVQNGKANSVVLNNVAQNSALVLFDNNSATFDNDSWCLINVLEDIDSYTVDSFEDDKTNSSIKENYHSNGGKGLDGKVSYISVYAPWPTSAPETVLTGTNNDVEPSGLAIWSDGTTTWLYQASDNGKLGRMNVNNVGAGWTYYSLGSDKQWAFESITAFGDKLMVGVEGGETGETNPLLREFDPADTTDSSIGSFTGNVWSLDVGSLGSNKGMEAMTFVPASECPSGWITANNVFHGVFLVGFQVAPAEIRVYNLPPGNGGTQIVGTASNSNEYGMVASFTDGLLNLKLSDLCFANGYLWALYDDTFDALQKIGLAPSITVATQTMPTISQSGQSSLPTQNCEGITFHGSTMYLALDQNSSSLSNYIFQYDNFSID